MANWNTMHIFGYGESQMIGPDKNGKVANDTLSTIAPLISYLASLQQEGTNISMENLFALNMFKEEFIDFYPNTMIANKAQRFKMVDLDLTTLNNFADELSGAIPEQIEENNFSPLRNRIRNRPNVIQ